MSMYTESPLSPLNSKKKCDLCSNETLQASQSLTISLWSLLNSKDQSSAAGSKLTSLTLFEDLSDFASVSVSVAYYVWQKNDYKSR